MNGAELIAAERQRQIDSEGWSPEHDDQWTRDELLEAAECYIYASRNSSGYEVEYDAYDINWPWDTEWFKPCPEESDRVDHIRCLEKAGALIAAEIDRLQRKDSRDAE